jgi:hypothetical protein
MLNGRASVEIFKPKWKIPAGAQKEISVRVHRDEANLRQKLFNEPLRAKRGELDAF